MSRRNIAPISQHYNVLAWSQESKHIGRPIYIYKKRFDELYCDTNNISI